jgi:hypothetical protein
MKYAILFACILGTGWLSSHDEINLVEQMQGTCHKSYLVTSGPLEEECGQLIDRIQKNNKLEVLTDNQGNFWVESK